MQVVGRVQKLSTGNFQVEGEKLSLRVINMELIVHMGSLMG